MFSLFVTTYILLGRVQGSIRTEKPGKMGKLFQLWNGQGVLNRLKVRKITQNSGRLKFAVKNKLSKILENGEGG